MKKLFILFSLFMLGLSVGVINAQSSSVTVNVQDPSGQNWANGYLTYTFAPAPGIQGPYQWQGANLPANYLVPTTVVLDATGSATFSIPDNTKITPSNSTWTFTICSNTSFQCATTRVGVSGASINISSSINNTLAAISLSATTFPRAYSSNEININQQQGGIYWDTSASCAKVYNGILWTCLATGSSLALNVTNTGTSGPATYNPGTFTLNIPVYVPSTGGYVFTNPVASQTITSAAGSIFTVTQINNTAASVQAEVHSLDNGSQGYDLGNGITASHQLESHNYLNTTRGNNQIIQSTANNYASGDVDLFYEALLYAGGCKFGSDECSHMRTGQMHQVPLVYGPIVQPSSGRTDQSYHTLAAGNVYFDVSYPVVITAPVAFITMNFQGTTVASTAQIGFVTLGSSNTTATFNPSQVVTVNIPAVSGAHSQTWSVAGATLPAISASAGQVLAFATPASTNGVTADGGFTVCLPSTTMPTTGTFTMQVGGAPCSTIGSYGVLQAYVAQAAPTTGATSVNISPVSYYGYLNYNLTPPMFSDDSIAIDSTQQSPTYGTGTITTHASILGYPTYALSSGTIPTSSAFGTLSSCSGAGTGTSQVPVSVTCTVTPSTSPISGAFTGPINFTGTTTNSSTTISSVSSTAGLVVGQTVIAPGLPYQDTIASIGTGSITMTLPATASNTAEAMSINSDISIPREEAQVTSVTALSGGTQQITFLSVQPPAYLNSIVGQGGMAGAAVTNLPNGYIMAWQIIASLPGNIFIVSNCRTGSCAASNGNLPVAGSGYFYPMAWVNGTNGAISGSAQLIANTIPFNIGDNFVDTLMTEVGGGYDWLIYGQNTPTDYSIPTTIHSIQKDGPFGPAYDWLIYDNGASPTGTMMRNSSTYNYAIFDMANIPPVFLQFGDGPIAFTGVQIAGVYGYGNFRADPAGWSISAPFKAVSLAENLISDPSTSSSLTCTVGQTFDSLNWHYVCTATNTTKRTALNSW